METFDSFVFYRSWRDAIVELPSDVRLEVYEGVIRYALGETVEGLKPLAQVAFSFIKNDIDRYRNNYHTRVVVRNRENGALGGRPKGSMKNPEKPKKPSGFLENPKNPEAFLKTQKTLNDNDNVISSIEESNIELSIDNSGLDNNFFAKKLTRARAKKPPQKFATEHFGAIRPAVEQWLAYKAEIGDSYRSQSSVDIMARRLYKLSGGDAGKATQIIEQAIANNWKGFFELKGNESRFNKNDRGAVSDDYRASILRDLGAL